MFSVQILKKLRIIKGFTLIELMVVIAVIAILATIALFGLRQAQASARDVTRIATMNNIRAALERYYGDSTAGYPSGTSFTAMLVTIGYSTIGLTDPGCGSGTLSYSGASADWSPSAVTSTCTFLNAPSYKYALTAGATSGYTLTLNKEGGGTSLFTNPK